MSEKATLSLDGKEYELPVIVGTENEKAVDISKLRAETGYITYDDGYGNTGSCISSITYIDGENGILRYRGIDIAEIAEKSDFIETAYLIIYGRFPTREERQEFNHLIVEHELLHESMRNQFQGFPFHAHPMAVLSAMINSMSCFHPQLLEIDDESKFIQATARLLSKVRTIAAFSYKHSVGQPLIYPTSNRSYTENFLHMMFSAPNTDYEPDPDVVRAMDLMFILHADHEQNCSTSTVRMVGSSKANLFTSVAAGVSALWGRLHGGANQAVLEMLMGIHERGESIPQVLAKAKDKNSDFRLMGFGHRVYKNFDPRARIIKDACDKVLYKLGKKDPLLGIAKDLAEAALEDEYFVERKLYPNVDFYSGIIMRAIGIPINMFTVMFAIGRMPGWIANWKETQDNPKGRIYRPRQIYNGPAKRSYEQAKTPFLD
ncbi:MAG: citrate synthase [Candidatus Sumerlaeia bacterium]|nr:citrate synthase [Candidatus Sumerlaeia bacterium]